MAKFSFRSGSVAANNTGTAETKEIQKAEVSFDDLKSKKAAAKEEYEVPFPVTCMIKGNVVIFSAQLQGGERFSTTPVMPKAIDGSIIAPEQGAEGWLKIVKSSNCKLTRDTTGKYEFSIRPEFADFETVADRDARLKAEKKG